MTRSGFFEESTEQSRVKATIVADYLIFVSKHVLGYTIMKEVMAKQNSKADQGVPSFSYCPADRKYPLLFELTRPLDDLEDMFREAFAGQTLTMRGIFEKHHVGRPYLSRNYKEVLQKLETDGKITADPPASKRRRNTFADEVRVTFPTFHD